MLRSFAALQEVDAGFDPDGLLTFQVFLAAGRYPDGNATGPFIRDLTERLAAIPGVSGAVAMSGLPPLRQVNANDIDFEDYTAGTGDPPENIDYYQFVHGDYFEVMGIDIVAGRPFHAGDADTVALAAILNERAVETFFRDLDPIGRRVNIFGVSRPLTIVGVARDVKQGGLSEEVGTEIYFYNPQVASLGFAVRAMNLAVRVERGDPLALAGEVRRIVAGLDPGLPVASLQSMEQNMAGAITRPRFLTLLLGIFAAVALALAAIGTYGVMAYSVAERSHEFGIRMAMGARSRGVLAMVLRSGMTTAGIGVALGIVGALVATRLMESMLFGVGTRDLPTFLAAPVVLLAVAAAASFIPARRATRLDPANVLREE
jgi:putative ABC transport system permease protein